jgi:hypothetical protein
LDTYVFKNKIFKRNRENYLIDIIEHFSLSSLGRRNDISLWTNNDMWFDIDRRWISVIILDNNKESNKKIQDYFYK